MSSIDTEKSGRLDLARPSPRALLVVLLGVAAFLAAMHVLSNVVSVFDVLLDHFDLNLEQSIPTWWSSVQLLALGVLLGLLALNQFDDDRRTTRSLYLGSLIAIFFSADEVATLHESLARALEGYGAIPRFSGDQGIWILVYGVLGLATLVLGLLLAATGVVLLRR